MTNADLRGPESKPNTKNVADPWASSMNLGTFGDRSMGNFVWGVWRQFSPPARRCPSCPHGLINLPKTHEVAHAMGIFGYLIVFPVLSTSKNGPKTRRCRSFCIS